MYQMKRFIDMEQSTLSVFLLLSNWFNFSISFSRVIIVQDFQNVTSYVLLAYSSLFILYISTTKPSSLVKGYIEVKINKQEIW